MSEACEDFVVETFSIWLTGFDGFLASKNSVADVETQLMQQLDVPIRLLRWAIVRVQNNHLLCEGAFLKRISLEI